MIRPVTIQSRLLAIFTIAAVLPIAVVSLVSYHNSVEAVETMVGNRTSRLAAAVGEELSRKLRGRLGDRILVVNEPVQRYLAIDPEAPATTRMAATVDLQNYTASLFEEYGRYYREMILADAEGTPLFRFGRSKGTSRAVTIVQPVRQTDVTVGAEVTHTDTFVAFIPEELPLPGALAERVEEYSRNLEAQLQEAKALREEAERLSRESGAPPAPPGAPVTAPALPEEVLDRIRDAFSRPAPEVRSQDLIGPEDPRLPVILDLDRGRFSEEEKLAARTGTRLAADENLVFLHRGSAGQAEAVRLVRPVFSATAPDERLGVIILDLRVDYLFPEDLSGERFGSKGDLAVVNRKDGEILYHSRPELVGQALRIAAPDLADHMDREEAEGEDAGWFDTRDESGRRLAAMFPIDAVPWTVIASASPREFEAEAREAGFLNLIVASAALLLALGFLLLSSRKISRSVHVVTEGAREIAAGNLRHTIQVESRDEIQTLADTFNAMTASLRENIALRERAVEELEALNRTLEDRVTERTRELQSLNEALNRANQELKELDRLKSNFLATVSHEFKTPLTSITAFSEILLDDMTEAKASAEILRFLTIINTESGRLGRLIRNLLDLSRIEAGRMRWEHSVFPIQEVVVASLDGLLPVFSEKRIQVHREVSCPHAWVDADRDRIQQVITNLIENAVKFSSKGSKVWIGCREHSASSNGRNFLEFTVRDQGPGIPESQLVRIFERFHQVDNTETRGTGGSGLGLAISREIVEHHGGTIWVESAPGMGATFHFTIPCLRKDEHG